MVHDRLAGVILLGVAEKEMQSQKLPLLRRAIPAFAVPGPIQLHLFCRQVGVAAAKVGKGIDPLTALRFSHVAQNICNIMDLEGDHFVLICDVVDGRAGAHPDLGIGKGRHITPPPSKPAK